MLNKKSVLITGGTGSFGKKFIETVFAKFPNVKRMVVYSRDELKQFEMMQQFSPIKYPAMRYFIGDVRDLDRLKQATEGIDYIINGPKHQYYKNAIMIPLDLLIKHLESKNGKDQTFWENVPADYVGTYTV